MSWKLHKGTETVDREPASPLLALCDLGAGHRTDLRSQNQHLNKDLRLRKIDWKKCQSASPGRRIQMTSVKFHFSLRSATSVCARVHTGIRYKLRILIVRPLPKVCRVLD